jgi:hypothetical protein
LSRSWKVLGEAALSADEADTAEPIGKEVIDLKQV